MQNRETKTTISFYYRDSIAEAKEWVQRIGSGFKDKIKIVKNDFNQTNPPNAPELIIVLGGDGTILEAAQKTRHWHSKILGLNLGHVGFLASVRNPSKFVSALEKTLSGKYRVLSRNLIEAKVIRNHETVLEQVALNEVVIQSILGMVATQVRIGKKIANKAWGTGIMVATPTGSTAYNLSAHGPIVMPEVDCFIITKILDHGLPTPSLVVPSSEQIKIDIKDFREANRLILPDTKESVDVVLSCDGQNTFKLKQNDIIKLSRSIDTVDFIELEPSYFIKSLQKQFNFK